MPRLIAMDSSDVRRKITVEGNALRFAAAHFTTFQGQAGDPRSEPLHGHNYDVFVEVEGQLTDDAWIFDFVELKQMAAALCQELDHRFLLPLDNPRLSISETESAYAIACADRRYVIPKGDVCVLPIDNSTAERLAEWLCGRLAQELRARGAANVTALTVGVEEAPGQAGWYRTNLAAS